MVDWSGMVAVNRARLAGMLGALKARLGAVLTRGERNDAFSELRRQEAVARRLIATLAREVVVRPRAVAPPPAGPIPRGEGGGRAPSFGLFDPRIRPGPPPRRTRGNPQIRDFHEPFRATPPAPSPDDPVCGARLRRRIAALEGALADLPRQARKLARALAKAGALATARAAQPATERRKRLPWLRAMRPGRPPGQRKRGRDALDVLLADCHEIAVRALADAEALAAGRRDAVPP